MFNCILFFLCSVNLVVLLFVTFTFCYLLIFLCVNETIYLEISLLGSFGNLLMMKVNGINDTQLFWFISFVTHLESMHVLNP